MNTGKSRLESTPNTGNHLHGVAECSRLGTDQLEFVVEPVFMPADGGGRDDCPLLSFMKRNFATLRLKS